MQTLVYIEGRKGEGKSTLARTIVLEHAAEGYPFVVYDTTREWVPSKNVLVLSAVEYSPDEAAMVAIELQATLVVDEIDRYLQKTSNPRADFPVVHSIIHYGRHLNTGLLCCARRPASVHNDVLELADVIFLLYHSGVSSCQWIRELLGSDVAERVKSLRPGEWTRVDY